MDEMSRRIQTEMNTKKAQGILSLRAENPDSIIEHELRKNELYENK